MTLAESIRIALRMLRTNKVRTSLTMLGVAIGVASVVILLSLGVGVQSSIASQIEGLGTNLLFVFPGQTSGGTLGSVGGLTKQFKLSDVRYLQQRVLDAAYVVPVMQASATIRAGNRVTRSGIAASNGDAVHVFTAGLAAGRHYDQAETEAGARLAALAATPRRALFPVGDPIGRSIEINGQRFRVTGYYRPQGGSLGGDLDNQVYVPITTAQRLLGRDTIDYIVVKSPSTAAMRPLRAEIGRAMAARYGDQFTVFSQEQSLGVLTNVLGTLTALLAALAGISLLVGGVGIMSIMLVSVAERTREIGLRKAVGAKPRDILSQFVIEALALSVLGGLQGLALGGIGLFVASRYAPMRMTWWAAAIAFSVAAITGVFFGVYPAWKASRLDPIVALQAE
jgi:putative ABC transport system permease protein